MVSIFFGLFGGLALFIFALQSISEGLQKIAGKKANKVMGTLTSVPLIGVLVGALVTIVAQSSSVVTVMVVGFVNASLMTLKQAIAVIMGANVGTTLTAQLVAFRITDLWPHLMAIGFIAYFFFKVKRVKTTGFVCFSAGMLLLGMSLMSQAMVPLRGEPAFQNLMITFSNFRFLGLLAGMAFTALIQSSTAATGVIVAMAMEGLIPFSAALPLVLGTNVGTCITAMLASIGTTVHARRAAMSHVVLNLFGATLFLVFLSQFESLILFVSPYDDVARQVANAHTLFSVITVALFLPFITPYSKLITKLVPGEEQTLSRGPIYLDWNVLQSPALAIGMAEKELLRMADLATENLEFAMDAFFHRDSKKIKQMKEQELVVDDLEKEISRYLARVSQSGMDEAMSIRHTGLLHAANDVERVSDHATNIAELTEAAIEENIQFNPEALEELREMYALVLEAYKTAIDSVRNDDLSLVPKVHDLEEQIDDWEETLRNSHIKRLKDGLCSPDAGVIYLDIISNFERIGDHSNNIADVAQGEL